MRDNFIPKEERNNAAKHFYMNIVDTVYDMSRLDNLTTSYVATQKLVNSNLTSDNMRVDEVKVLLNLKATITLIINNYDQMEISINTIKLLHKNLSNDLMERSLCGEFRKSDVIMRNLEPEIKISPISEIELNQKIESIMSNEKDNIEDKIYKLGAMIIKEQPFADCNKRTALSFMNFILIKENLGYINLNEKTINTTFNESLKDLFLNNDNRKTIAIFKESISFTEEYKENQKKHIKQKI